MKQWLGLEVSERRYVERHVFEDVRDLARACVSGEIRCKRTPEASSLLLPHSHGLDPCLVDSGD
jgi:hypothetical protein